MIKGIVCIGANGVMGKDGQMPWGKNPLDGEHFRRMTEGHIVVMGRKTWESMGKRALPNRSHVVLRRDGWTTAEQVIIGSHNYTAQDTWIIGGAEIFRLFLPHIEEMYVTIVGDSFDGDTYFPDMHANYEWSSELLGTAEKDGHHLIFRKFTKIRNRNENADV